MKTSTYELAQKLSDEIITKRVAFLESKIKRYPCRNFRASDIHECDRYLVHSVLDWEQKTLHDASLQALFEAGNEGERTVIIHLQTLGFNVIQQQTPFEIKNKAGGLLCRGMIDGKLLYEGQAIPFEIKTMNQNSFNAIKDIDDFQRKPHLRKYLRQMQLYLYGNNIEAGLFVLYDLQGHYKLIPVALDYGECEAILKRIERAFDFLQRKEYPARIDYAENLCGHCPFSHVCLPDTVNKPPEMINNLELEATLERREQLQASVEEFKNIDEQVKAAFINVPQAFVGSAWHIVGKPRTTKRVNIKAMPDDLREKYTETTPSWITKIIRLGKSNENSANN